MHASTRFLAAFLPFALASAGACAVTEAAAPPSKGAAIAGTGATETAAALRPSTRAALERVLDVVVTPGRTDWELSRIDARGDDRGVHLVLDVDVLGSDEVAVTVNLELLLDVLRGLEGAREVDVRESHALEPTRLRLRGVSLEFAPEPPRALVKAVEQDFMVTLRGLAAEPDVRLGGVDIEKSGGGDEKDGLRISAHMPSEGERLDRLRIFLGELEQRVPDARVVRISLKPAWRAGAEPAPSPARFHWHFDVERGV